MEEYLNSLIRIEVEETLEEKIEKVKTKSSIKEEEFDSPQGNIEDVFSDEEKNNALNYSSTKEESKIDFNYLDNLSEEELEIELKNLENNLL
jgi:hypothetical protein